MRTWKEPTSSTATLGLCLLLVRAGTALVLSTPPLPSSAATTTTATSASAFAPRVPFAPTCLANRGAGGRSSIVCDVVVPEPLVSSLSSPPGGKPVVAPPAAGGALAPTIPETTAGAVVATADLATNIAELYAQANVALQTRQYTEAIGLFERLTQLDPQDGRVWIKLMTAHKRARQYAEGEAAIRRGIRACPTNARMRQALADVCRQSKRYEEARKHFRKAMRLEPSLASVYDSWGRMEAMLGQHALAASLYERGLELKPTSRLCHAFGVLLDTQGDSEKAKAVLRRGLKLPNEASNPQLLHALGMVEVRAGNTAAARSHLSTAIKEHPSFTMAYLSLGQLEERLGNHAAARRHYEGGATAKQPAGHNGAVQLWQSWARMESLLGRPVAAMQLYKRAHKRFPNDHQLVIEWAKLAGEHGETGVARTLFERATSRRRQNAKGGASEHRPTPYSFQCAATFEVRANHTNNARSYFERGAALPVQPGTKAEEERMPLLHAWAVFEWRQGKPGEARRLFREAEGAASDTGCGWLLQWRARFEAEQGNAVLSRHYYARSVNVAPQDSTAWRMWAEMEAEFGQAERALELQRHAQFVETRALLQSGGLGVGSTRRGGGGANKNPLARTATDVYKLKWSD